MFNEYKKQVLVLTQQKSACQLAAGFLLGI